MSTDANRLIYLNGQPVPVTEEVYLEWYRPIWRCHDFARRHGQCSLSRWQLCEGDCAICRFRMAGDHSSLDDLHDAYELEPADPGSDPESIVIYRLTCSRLSPCSLPNSSFERDFDTTGVEVRSVRWPCLFMASRRILYENAFSLGRMVDRCRLDSTIKIMASSRLISRTSAFTVSSPASSQAFSDDGQIRSRSVRLPSGEV